MNSTLMQPVTSPADLTLSSAGGSIPDALEKTLPGFRPKALILEQMGDGIFHQAGHRLIALGGIDTKAP
jgi:hypothetical protein